MSRQTIKAGSDETRSPRVSVLLCQYLFDTLRCDAFMFAGGCTFEGLVATDSEDGRCPARLDQDADSASDSAHASSADPARELMENYSCDEPRSRADSQGADKLEILWRWRPVEEGLAASAIERDAAGREPAESLGLPIA